MHRKQDFFLRNLEDPENNPLVKREQFAISLRKEKKKKLLAEKRNRLVINNVQGVNQSN